MCAKGRHAFTEKWVRSIYDAEEVLKVLRAEVPTVLKSSFVRVLHGTYFSAASVTEWRGETVMGVGRVAMTEAVMEGLEAGYRRYILGTA